MFACEKRGTIEISEGDGQMETTLYFGGSFLTMEQPTYAQALVEQAGRIVYVGTLEEAERLAGSKARRVNLEGRTLLPAFVDAHSHLLACAYARLQVPLGDCTSWDEIVNRLRLQVQTRAILPGAWVKGTGYDSNALEEGTPPDRWALDRACPHNPVVIQHTSGHAGVFNTLALERLGVQSGACDLPRDARGELTGRVEETPFLNLLGQVPLESLEEVLAAFQEAQTDYLAHGIATAQEGLLQAAMVPVYREILKRGLLRLDVEAYASPGEYAALKADFAQAVNAGSGRFHLAGEKIFLDGSPQGRTAWMREPYVGGGHGTSTMTDAQVLEVFEQALDQGVQLLAHCNGDAAAEQYLTLLEQAERKKGKRLRRPVMIHAQLLGKDQLEQVKRLQVILSFFVAHVYHWGEIHIKNFGLERACAISPVGSALRQGIPFTFHQDSPVIPPDMLETLWCACTRRTKAGRVLGEEERISIEAGLGAVTQNAAFQYFAESEKGSLRAGKRADFVLLSGDPRKTAPEDLKKLQVEETIKDGSSLWRR